MLTKMGHARFFISLQMLDWAVDDWRDKWTLKILHGLTEMYALQLHMD